MLLLVQIGFEHISNEQSSQQHIAKIQNGVQISGVTGEVAVPNTDIL